MVIHDSREVTIDVTARRCSCHPHFSPPLRAERRHINAPRAALDGQSCMRHVAPKNKGRASLRPHLNTRSGCMTLPEARTATSEVAWRCQREKHGERLVVFMWRENPARIVDVDRWLPASKFELIVLVHAQQGRVTAGGEECRDHRGHFPIDKLQNPFENRLGHSVRLCRQRVRTWSVGQSCPLRSSHARQARPAWRVKSLS